MSAPSAMVERVILFLTSLSLGLNCFLSDYFLWLLSFLTSVAGEKRVFLPGLFGAEPLNSRFLQLLVPRLVQESFSLLKVSRFFFKTSK